MTKIAYYRRCASGVVYRRKFHENKRVYTANINTCNCRTFKYNGSCQHIARVQEDVCQWDEQDEIVPVNPEDRMHCPVCGAPATVYAVEEDGG